MINIIITNVYILLQEWILTLNKHLHLVDPTCQTLIHWRGKYSKEDSKFLVTDGVVCTAPS